jgi:hypothetical protein
MAPLEEAYRPSKEGWQPGRVSTLGGFTPQGEATPVFMLQWDKIVPIESLYVLFYQPKSVGRCKR